MDRRLQEGVRRSSRVRLRVDDRTDLALLDDADAGELYAVIDRDREDLARWLPWAPLSTLDGTRGFIADSLERHARGDGFDLGLWHDGAIVGGLGLHHIDALDHTTSLGYWLAPNARGRGLMTRACARLIDHCFQDLDLHRVEIRIAPGNEGSLRVAKRLGAKEEGRLREATLLHGRREDLLVHSILRHEWQG